MLKTIIHTTKAPQAIGTYSQAVRVGNTVYLSGQIPLDPVSMTMVAGDFSDQVRQVFKNLQAVCVAADGDLHDIVKLNIYLTDLKNFQTVNAVMADYIQEPYPARAAVAVSQLPKEATIEIEGVMVLG